MRGTAIVLAAVAALVTWRVIRLPAPVAVTVPPAPSSEISRMWYGDPEIVTRIAQYEMAYRMQTSAPEAARPRAACHAEQDQDSQNTQCAPSLRRLFRAVPTPFQPRDQTTDPDDRMAQTTRPTNRPTGPESFPSRQSMSGALS